jgi:hypothetical protein
MAKLVGTLVSLGGAMVLTLYKGVALTHAASPHHGRQHQAQGHAKWTLGTLAILGNCVCLSCWFLLHGRLARKYPHVYSCNSLVSGLSFLQVAVVGLCTQRSITPWIIKSKFQILTVLYAVMFSTLIISVVFVSFQCCGCSDMTDYSVPLQTLIHRASSDAASRSCC